MSALLNFVKAFKNIYAYYYLCIKKIIFANMRALRFHERINFFSNALTKFGLFAYKIPAMRSWIRAMDVLKGKMENFKNMGVLCVQLDVISSLIRKCHFSMQVFL